MDIQTFVAKHPYIISDAVVLDYIKCCAKKAIEMHEHGKDYKPELKKLVELINDFM